MAAPDWPSVATFTLSTLLGGASSVAVHFTRDANRSRARSRRWWLACVALLNGCLVGLLAALLVHWRLTRESEAVLAASIGAGLLSGTLGPDVLIVWLVVFLDVPGEIKRRAEEMRKKSTDDSD